MRVEYRLKHILVNSGLWERISIRQIARETGLARNTVGGIINNTTRGVDLDTVERLCRWLRRHHIQVPLPEALFGAAPSHMARALRAPGLVTFYVGEYLQPVPEHGQRPWLSRADAEVASQFIHLLSDPDGNATGNGAPAHLGRMRFGYVFVPSQFTQLSGQCAGHPADAQQHRRALRVFNTMRRDTCGGSAILIGSQRANFLVEPFVADLLGCEPFVPAPGCLPFYLSKPAMAGDSTPSCFGGPEALNDEGADGTPGIYYRDASGRLEFCPSRWGVTDAGIVIVRRDPGHERVEMAIIGFSWIATSAIGKEVVREPDLFWGPFHSHKGGIQVAASVCRLRLRPCVDPEEPTMCHQLDEIDVTPIRIDVRATARKPAARQTRTPALTAV